MFRVAILTVSLAAIMLCGLITPVDAAQMTFRTFSQSGVSEDAEIKFVDNSLKKENNRGTFKNLKIIPHILKAVE